MAPLPTAVRLTIFCASFSFDRFVVPYNRFSGHSSPSGTLPKDSQLPLCFALIRRLATLPAANILISPFLFLHWPVAFSAVVFYIAGNMEKAEVKNVRPTYVLLSPYACRNNKTVELIAKHGSLFFATIFLVLMILLRLSTNDNNWIVFLPQFVFFSLAYIFGCVSNNKWIQLIQILGTVIVMWPYTLFITRFARITLVEKHCAGYLVSLIPLLMAFYPTVLHLVYRKYYVKDLSTPKSVSTLNFVDFFYYLVFVVCLCSMLPVLQLLRTVFPSYSPSNHQKVLESGMSWLEWACCFSYEIIALVGCYIFVTYCNRSKPTARLVCVKIDNDGRAWYSVCGNFVRLLKGTGLCFLWLICCCGCCCGLDKLVGRNRSSVKPEETQKLPLKTIPEMIV